MRGQCSDRHPRLSGEERSIRRSSRIARFHRTGPRSRNFQPGRIGRSTPVLASAPPWEARLSERFEAGSLLTSRLLRHGKNPAYRSAQRRHPAVWHMVRASLAVLTVDQYRPAAGRGPSVDIAPSISDHEAALQVDSSARCSVLQESGFRLAAVAAGGVAMKADAEFIDWQSLT